MSRVAGGNDVFCGPPFLLDLNRKDMFAVAAVDVPDSLGKLFEGGLQDGAF